MLKRSLSLILALVIVFSLLPVQVLAEDAPETAEEQTAQETQAPETEPATEPAPSEAAPTEPEAPEETAAPTEAPETEPEAPEETAAPTEAPETEPEASEETTAPTEALESETDSVSNEAMLASVGTFGDDLEWSYDADTCTLTISGTGDMPDYGSYDEMPWYGYRSSIETVVIEDGVTSIGAYSFIYFNSLTSVTIPGSVGTIADSAFYSCKGLTNVTISSGVQTIGEYAFYYCEYLISITIPKSVQSIGYAAFRNCNKMESITFEHESSDTLTLSSSAFDRDTYIDLATTVTIPSWRNIHTGIRESLENSSYRTITWAYSSTNPIAGIEIQAQDGAEAELGMPIALRAAVTPTDAITEVVWSVSDPEMAYISADGDDATVTGMKTGTVTVRCASAGDETVCGEIQLTVTEPTAELTGITALRVAGDIPGEIELGVPAQMVAEFQPANAADRDVIWEVDNGTGSATIDQNGVVTPLSAGTIVVTATSKTNSDLFAMRTVEILRYVEDITILLDGAENVTTISAGETMFISAVTAPADAKYQEADVVWSLQNGTGTAKLYDGCIEGVSAGTVTLTATSPDSRHHDTSIQLEVLGEEQPYAVNGGSIYYNTRTGVITRADSTVTEAVIPSSINGTTITGIAPYAFSERYFYSGSTGNTFNVNKNTTLTYVKIPDTVTYVDDFAFYRCTNLATLKLGSSVRIIGYCAFGECGITGLTVPDTVVHLGDYAFYECSKLSTLKLGSGVKSIGYAAFYESGITGVVIPDSVTQIGKYAFGYCSSIVSLTIPNSAVQIGDDAFYGMESLQTLTLPGELDTEDWLDFFGNNPRLQTLTLTGTKVCSPRYTEYEDGGFSCDHPFVRGAKTVILADTITTIEPYAFYRQDTIENVQMGANVQSIGKGAFESCNGLTELALPDSLQTIGEVAFEDCYSLEKINLPDSLQSIGEYAFSGCNKLQLIDLSLVPDAIMAKDTLLTNKAKVPETLVRATNGKTKLDWSEQTLPEPYDGPEAYNIAYVHWNNYPNGDCYLRAKSNGKILLVCYDEYTGARGSKEVSIETGIELRDVPAYLTSGQSATVKSYRMPDNKAESVTWRLDNSEYASLSATNGSSVKITAKSVDRAVQVKLSAIPNGGESRDTMIWILPKTTGISIYDDPAKDPIAQTGGAVQTVPVDMHVSSTVSLSAQMQPAGALEKLTWKSSADAIATVDGNGVVTLKKPGTVTITATAKDGSAKSASVKLEVTYLDAAPKLTARADIPAIGLQGGYSTTMLVYGQDKENPIDPAELTFSIPENQKDIAAVDEYGVITAGVKPGTATVTAAITGDPLGRKISLSVKVIAAQTQALTLESEEGGSQQVVILDKEDLAGGAYIFTVRPKAVDSLGEDMTLTQSSLKWTTTDNRIATVSANTDGSATVTVKAKTDGVCVINAVTNDYAKVESSMTVYVRDYAPRLDSTSLTLNPNLDAGVSVALLESYGNHIEEVSLHEYDAAGKSYKEAVSDRLEAYYEDGVLTVIATESIKNSTLKLRLRAVCGNGAAYTYDISVKVANTLPAITVKQPAKFNLNTGLRTQLSITAKNAAIADVALDQETSDSFVQSEFDHQSGLLTLEYVSGSVMDAKIEVDIYLEGYRDPIRKAVTIGTTSAKPTVTVKQSGKVNLFYSDSEAQLVITAKEMEIANAELDQSSTASFFELVGFDPGSGTMTLGLTQEYLDKEVKLDTSATLLVYPEGGGAAIAKTFTIATATTKPSLALSAASSVINTAVSSDHSTSFSIRNKTTGETLDLTGDDVTVNAAFATAAVLENDDAVALTLTGTAGGTATVLVQQGNWTQAIKLTHKVTVQTALPTPALGTSTLKLNNQLPGLTAETTLKLNQSNIQIDEFLYEAAGKTQAIRDEAQKIELRYEDGMLTAAIKPEYADNGPKAGTYEFRYTLTLANSGVTLPAKTVKVTVSSAAPAATVSAKGKLNTMDPTAPITYTVTKLSNIAGTVTGVMLEGEDAQLFEVALDDSGSKPAAKLTVAEGAEIATNRTYKLKLVFEVAVETDDGIITCDAATNISFKVSQTAVKFAAVPAVKLYQSRSSVSCTVALTTPATASLEDICLNSKTSAEFLRAMGDGELHVEWAEDCRSAEVRFEIRNPGYLVNGKSYTVYLDVTPANNAANVKPAQVKVTVKAYK